MATSTSPSRRVLGNKTTNASVMKLRVGDEENKSISNFQHLKYENWREKLSAFHTGGSVALTGNGHGQKRSIDQVDGTCEFGRVEQDPVENERPSSMKMMMKREEEREEKVKMEGQEGKDEEDDEIDVGQMKCENEVRCVAREEEESENDDVKIEREMELVATQKKEEVDDDEVKFDGEMELFTAQKEEDDVETQESKMKILPSKTVHEDTKASMPDSKATSSTLSSSFHSSQEGPPPVEEQFEIQDETSQKTLEQLNMTLLPQNPSQSSASPDARSSVTVDSQDTMKMSIFIDFTADGVDEEELKMIPPQPTMPLDGLARRVMIDEKAATLRTRLQLAAYRVNTGQIKTPFSVLKRRLRRRSPERRHEGSLPIKSEEDIVWDARSRATEQKKPAARDLKSIPFPTIVPTAYSARNTMAPPKIEPSSSPASTITNELETSRAPRSGTLTPKSNETQLRRTAMQSNSKSENGRGANKVKQQDQLYDDVTISGVKGEAANGLLDLIRAAAES